MSTTWSVDDVGHVAGEVWRFLSEHGRSSLSAVEKSVPAPASMVHMALGWLAREGKILIELDRRTIAISLAEG